MRKSFNGLNSLVSDQRQAAPARDVLFIFTNKRRNRIKLFYFDGTGTWVAAKRLETGRFSWPSPSETGQRRIKLAPEALQLLIIPDEVLANPDDWQGIGEENHDEIDVIKGEMFWRRIIRKKFVSKTDKTQAPVIAPAPLPSIPGTLLAPALAAQIITNKYQDHLPHYRQSQRSRRTIPSDLKVSSPTPPDRQNESPPKNTTTKNNRYHETIDPIRHRRRLLPANGLRCLQGRL